MGVLLVVRVVGSIVPLLLAGGVVRFAAWLAADPDRLYDWLLPPTSHLLRRMTRWLVFFSLAAFVIVLLILSVRVAFDLPVERR